MAWQTRDVLDERAKFVVRATTGRENFSALCREFGISRPTGYLWKKRYETSGSILSVMDSSRRPHRSPNRTSKRDESNVIRRRKKFGWGAKKLQWQLQQDGLPSLSLRTINRILDRNNLIADEDRVRQATKRFERAAPNQLWQMDFKGEFRDFIPFCFPLTILDDHSRFSLAIGALKDTSAEPAEKYVVKVFETYGLPDAMLMDHGSPWWSTRSESGLTKFSLNLIRQGIKLQFSGVGHPQTQDKIERFHRTLKREVKHRGVPKHFSQWQKLFEQIRTTYNNHRPHEALAMATPQSRYRPSNREYNPNPNAWEYPENSLVEKVDTAGCIRYQTRQVFISHCLVGDHIQLIETKQRLVVIYRNMLIREIDLNTGIGRPMAAPHV